MSLVNENCEACEYYLTHTLVKMKSLEIEQIEGLRKEIGFSRADVIKALLRVGFRNKSEIIKGVEKK